MKFYPLKKIIINDFGDEIMTNNDLLLRLRYALDIKDRDMLEIFKLGGIELTREELLKILVKRKGSEEETATDILIDEGLEDTEKKSFISCSNSMLEAFLDGFIIFKRGKQETKEGVPVKKEKVIKDNKSVNNVFIKMLKIALSLNSEDIIEIMELAGATISKGELSAVLRKEGHRNYKECGDKYIRNFLKGLAIKNRYM